MNLEFLQLGVTRYLQPKGGDQTAPTTSTTTIGGDVGPTTTQTQAQTMNGASGGGQQASTSGVSPGDRSNGDVSVTATSGQLVLPIPLFSQMRFTESNMVSVFLMICVDLNQNSL